MKTKEQENIDKLVNLLDTRKYKWDICESDFLLPEIKTFQKKFKKMTDEIIQKLIIKEDEIIRNLQQRN